MAFGIFMEFLVNIQSAINYMRMNKEEFCHAYFAKERYVQAYDMIVHPMLDESMWPAAMGDPLEPPPLRRLLGRSPTKKGRGAGEGEGEGEGGSIIQRKLQTISCSNCNQFEHNKKTLQLLLQLEGDGLIEEEEMMVEEELMLEG